MIGSETTRVIVVDHDDDPTTSQRGHVEPVKCCFFLCVRCRDQPQRFQAVCIFLTLAVPDHRTVVCRTDDVGQVVETQGRQGLRAGRPAGAIPMRLWELFATGASRVGGFPTLDAVNWLPCFVGVGVEADVPVGR